MKLVDFVQSRRGDGSMKVLQLRHHRCMVVLHLVFEGLRRGCGGGSRGSGASDPILEDLQGLIALDLGPLCEHRSQAAPIVLHKVHGHRDFREEHRRGP